MLRFIVLFVASLLPINWLGCSGDEDDRYRDPLGFSLKLGSGWKASFDKGAFIKFNSQDGKSLGVVFPFLAKEAMSAEVCLERAPNSFTDVIPNAKLISKRQTKQKPDEAVGEFSSDAGAVLALCSLDGASGVLYLAATPDGIKSGTMKSIIATFKTVSFDEPGKFFVKENTATWIDPKENAFRIKVPEGWNVDGGLFRAGSVDVRIHIRMTSPDGKISVGIGDKDLPKYTTGWPEGQIYNPGYGNTMTGKPFISGGAFAQEYANNNSEALGCPGGQSEGKELDEITRAMQQIYDQQNLILRTKVSVGEARLNCTKDGVDHVGYVVAKLTLAQDGQGIDSGIWEADMTGFSAPQSRESEAFNAAFSAYQSFQYEPAWHQAQQGTTAATANIVAKTNNEISAMISKQYAKTQVTMDRIFRNWSNATLGQTDIVDPTTGETYKIASGKNYYWRKAGTDVIAGTNQYERPDIDFSPMLEY